MTSKALIVRTSKALVPPETPRPSDPEIEVMRGVHSFITDRCLREANLFSSWALVNSSSLNVKTARRIASALTKNRNLESLTIRGSRADAACISTILDGLIESWDSGIAGLTAVVKPMLTSLDLGGNFMWRGPYESTVAGEKIYGRADEGLAALVNVLTGASRLKHLDLSKSALNFETAGRLLEPLGEHKTLQTLDLSSNRFGGKVALPLAHFVRLHSNCLRVLNLRGCYIDNLGVTLLAKPLTCAQALETLILASNDIGDSGAKLLGESLNKLNAPNLEHIDLSRNRIGPLGCAMLAVPIKLRRLPLRFLDLSHNPLTTTRRAGPSSLTSAKDIAQPKGTPDQRLATVKGNLRDRNHGHPDFRGVLKLFESMQANRSVSELRMVACGLVGRAFELRKDYRAPPLETGPGVEAVRGVAAMLRENTCLLRLDLRHNAISARLRRPIDAALKEMPTAIPAIGAVRVELDRRCRAALKRNPSYPRAAARWLRIRMYRAVLPLLEQPRVVLT